MGKGEQGEETRMKREVVDNNRKRSKVKKILERENREYRLSRK